MNGKAKSKSAKTKKNDAPDLFGASGEKPVEKLSEAEARKELERLATEMAEHDRAYYEQDARPSPTPNMTPCASATPPSKCGFQS